MISAPQVFNLAAAAAAAAGSSPSSSSSSAAKKKSAAVAAVAADPDTDATEPLEECTDDNAPLFYSPGKRGFYSPIQGRATPERLNAYRNVGRLMGLCLLQWSRSALYCPFVLKRAFLSPKILYCSFKDSL